MKKIIKKTTAVLMSIVMVLVFSACGGSDSDGISGKFLIHNANIEGFVIDSSSLSLMGMQDDYIDIKEDGSADLMMYGMNFTAELDFNAKTVIIEGDTLTLEVDGDKLAISGDGLSLNYILEGSSEWDNITVNEASSEATGGSTVVNPDSSGYTTAELQELYDSFDHSGKTMDDLVAHYGGVEPVLDFDGETIDYYRYTPTDSTYNHIDYLFETRDGEVIITGKSAELYPVS